MLILMMDIHSDKCFISLLLQQPNILIEKKFNILLKLHALCHKMLLFSYQTKDSLFSKVLFSESILLFEEALFKHATFSVVFVNRL